MLLLVVLLLGCWVGGISFLTNPSGSGLGMTTDQLPRWPLLDDLGLLLVLGFGVLLLPGVVLLARHCTAGFRAGSRGGLVLVAWMLAELAAIGLLPPGMQIGFLVLGGVLILAVLLVTVQTVPMTRAGSRAV